MKRRQEPPGDPLELISNPGLTGIRVHPSLIEERAYDADLFLHIAHQLAREVGSKQAIRALLDSLKHPNEPDKTPTRTWDWIITIPIHPSLATERVPLMTEDDFVHSGEVAIYKHGVQKYFEHVMHHLAEGVLA